MRWVASLALIAVASIAVAQDETINELRTALESARGAERIGVLNDLAKKTQANAPKESIAYATEALELAEDLQDIPGQIRSLNNIGVAHYFLAEYDRALELYADSLELAERTGDDEAIASEVPRGREAPRVLNRGNENHRARFGGEFGEKRKRKKKRVTNSYAQTVTRAGCRRTGGRG